MKKNGIVAGILLIALFLGAWLLYENRYALQIVPESQTFTELYFNDYATLPTSTRPNKLFSFDFTIHNVEGVTTTYPYAVYFEYPNGEQVVFASSSVTLANDASTSITAYVLPTSNASGTVVVALTQLNQKIDFLLPNANQ